MRALVYLSLVFILGCESAAKNNELNTSTASIQSIDSVKAEVFTPIDSTFDRSQIQLRLNEKISSKKPLVVHAYIPLCDNIHQGIVPTTPTLGDGMNLKTNLYWATSGGTKAYFKKRSDWLLVYDAFDIDTNVLERVVFKKTYAKTTVYLVADAYRGDRMEACINDYLAAISVNRQDTIYTEQKDTVLAGGHADLFLFNGHNGVMDYINIKPWYNRTEKRSDVVMNSCVSYGYLQEEFMQAGGYPLVRSQTLLYPGAYVLAQIIDDWVAGISPEKMCLNAGRVYCEKHDCGAGTKVYKSGW